MGRFAFANVPFVPAHGIDRVGAFFTGIDAVMGLLWLGLAAFTVGLVVLMYTRWGQSHLLHKCMGLSLLAHLLLAGYATTVQIVYAVPPRAEGVFRVSLLDGVDQSSVASGDTANAGSNSNDKPGPREKPWEQFLHDTVAQPDTADAAPHEPANQPEPARQSRSEIADLPQTPVLPQPTAPETGGPDASPLSVAAAGRATSSKKEAESIKAPEPQRRDTEPLITPSADAPGPQDRTKDTQPAATRTADAGPASALLEQAAVLPRLADSANPSDPATALKTLDADTSQPTHLAPAGTLEGGADGPSSQAGAHPATSQTLPDSESARLDAPPITPLPRQYDHGTFDGLSATTASTAGVTGMDRSGRGEPPTGASEGSGPINLLGPPRLPSGRRDVSVGPLSDIYRLRTAPNRSRIAEHQGATPETEAAVKAALRWLADNQSGDGRWDARQHGAGRELLVLGQNRHNAGIDADSGVTGLALLAFLASGHTHQDGQYRENVRRGLEYLLGIQQSDGNLAGSASGFARMYCHAMATFAMSEAYGMTGDPRLESSVRRAVGYTVLVQHATSGGWRYTPADPGDTSQMGWQVMALKSAELAGIAIPDKTRQGVIRFLRSVSSGTHGGLAAYRPSEPATRSMTAEALLCWQFLGLPREHPAGNEAGDYVLGDLPPGSGKPNLYYWYYGTLAMYQLQGKYWHQWNEALQATLLSTQRKDGPLAGSWDTDTVWGGYGGRVYTTALATLCLEVYYRFLPLYAEAATKEDRAE